MQVFHIRYRNAQGALMRILNAASRRGLDLTSVHAEAAAQDHAVTLQLEASHKQIGQLCREWYAIVDVIAYVSSAALRQHGDPEWRRYRRARRALRSSRRVPRWHKFWTVGVRA